MPFMNKMGFFLTISKLDRNQYHLDPVKAQKGTEVLTSQGAPVLVPLSIQEFSISQFPVSQDSFSTCK